MENLTSKATPWNKGKLVDQKLPLKLKEIWATRSSPATRRQNQRPHALQSRH